MINRIGIFDPAFKNEGHFTAFNAYVGELVSGYANTLVFFDRSGDVTTAYAERHFPIPASFVRLPASPTWLSGFGRLGRLITRYLDWRHAFATIQESCDLLIITAEARDPFMYFVSPRIPYIALILFPYAYVKESYRSWYERFVARTYIAYIRRSAAYFTTSEPPMLERIQRLLDLPYLDWLPNLPVYPLQNIAKSGERAEEFVTLGTISRSKSHLFMLDVFEKHRLPYRYRIAGMPLDEVGEKVVLELERLAADPGFSLTGEFAYLSSDRYEELLRGADFAVFPYDYTRGNISSQVLHDCFRFKTPIIAPAIEPFKRYVEEYGIGFLYTEGDADSCAATLGMAHAQGKEAFAPNFIRLHADHSFARIQVRFLERLMKNDERLSMHRG